MIRVNERYTFQRRVLTALLRDAMRELSAFRKKYAHLSELAKVFDAIDGLEDAV